MSELSAKDQSNSAELEAVPKVWAGAFDAYKYSKAAILQNWKPYLLIIFLSFVAGVVQEVLTPSDTMPADFTAFDFVVMLVFIGISLLLGIALVRVILAGIDRKKVVALEEIKKSVSMIPAYFAMAVVSATIILVSLLLLVVPFFFVMPRLVLAEYFLINKNMGPIDAIKASWMATKGHVTKVWGVVLASIAMALLALTIIGIPFAIYFLFMYSAAFGVLYAYLTRSKVENVAETSDPVAV